MPKKLIKRYMPNHETIRDHKHLQFFGDHLHNPNLWHLNRQSVSGAFAVGLFCAYIPVPFQMVIAAALAILFCTNLTISVALVWITNPITMPALFYFAYLVGAWAMQTPNTVDHSEFSVDSVLEGLGEIWEPFLLGCFISGTVLAILGYVGIRILWRVNITRRWEQRKKSRGSR